MGSAGGYGMPLQSPQRRAGKFPLVALDWLTLEACCANLSTRLARARFPLAAAFSASDLGLRDAESTFIYLARACSMVSGV